MKTLYLQICFFLFQFKISKIRYLKSPDKVKNVVSPVFISNAFPSIHHEASELLWLQSNDVLYLYVILSAVVVVVQVSYVVTQDQTQVEINEAKPASIVFPPLGSSPNSVAVATFLSWLRSRCCAFLLSLHVGASCSCTHSCRPSCQYAVNLATFHFPWGLGPAQRWMLGVPVSSQSG